MCGILRFPPFVIKNEIILDKWLYEGDEFVLIIVIVLVLGVKMDISGGRIVNYY